MKCGVKLLPLQNPDSALHKLERPQIYFENGEPAVLFCAAAMPGKLDDSFIIMVPLKQR